MGVNEAMPTKDLTLLRAALVSGDISLYEIEQALQTRLCEEYNKPAREVDSCLINSIEEMLQMSAFERSPAVQRVTIRSYDELIRLVKEGRG